MRIPLLGRLAGIRRKPRVKDISLDAAMLRLATELRQEDSFCVKEVLWHHGHCLDAKTFQVTLFRGPDLVVLCDGNNLQETLDRALAEYKLPVG